PGAFLSDLAGSLNNLGNRLSEAGRREEALAPTQEAVTIRRRLAEASPGAFLSDLAGSLNNLGIRLSEAGRREEALAAFEYAWVGLDPGAQAELQTTRARWCAESDDHDGQVADLRAAIGLATDEADPGRGARARRAVRAAIGELRAATGTIGGLPEWATVEITDKLMSLLNQAVAAPTWAETAELLRGEQGAPLLAPDARPARRALAALLADQPPVVAVLGLLDTIDAHGIDTVLDDLCDSEHHAQLIQGWLATPTWTASRRYLVDHPDLVADPRTPQILDASDDPTARQHAAIIRLLVTGVPRDDVYDIVLDPNDATEALGTALGTANPQRTRLVLAAAPQLLADPVTAAFAAMTLAALDGQPDQARETAGFLAEHLTDTGRLADGAQRLRQTAQRAPEHALVLHDLADTLSTPIPTPTEPAEPSKTAPDRHHPAPGG
ncbi:MAG: tetratricopeptide repeat protein, partial [Dactylosporangium sp.]|nr:tetratricopeptide repeat protein [Dactylosporangium sp.]